MYRFVPIKSRCGARYFHESLEKTRKASIIMDSENACNREDAEQLQMSENGKSHKAAGEKMPETGS